MLKSVEEKFFTVIKKNTFHFYNSAFEESYEGYINSLKETLLIVKNKIATEGLKKEIFLWLLHEKENGLKALLALTGFSNEYLKRLTTIIRIVDDPELNRLVLKDKWCSAEDLENVQEWSDATICNMIRENDSFRRGLVNIFFEGASIPFLINTIPLFELKKLSISKLNFEVTELIDTLIRYKEKGSYSGKRGNNPETVLAKMLDDLNITFEQGDLSELIDYAPNTKRTMDFIIPDKKNPAFIIESSFLATTSSGQGDKSKTELAVDALIKAHYPNAKFFGFVDGIGWYVRKSDLKRMVSAYEDVFTFHKDELFRFEQLIRKAFSK